MKAFSNNEEGDDIALGRILPIVDTVEQVEQLVQIPGITDIQLRIKDESGADHLYPSELFISVDLPDKAEKAVACGE